MKNQNYSAYQTPCSHVQLTPSATSSQKVLPTRERTTRWKTRSHPAHPKTRLTIHKKRLADGEAQTDHYQCVSTVSTLAHDLKEFNSQ